MTSVSPAVLAFIARQYGTPCWVYDAATIRRQIGLLRQFDVDWLVLHDAGAYGASMSSNYNSRPLAPEVQIDGDEIKLVRRRQTLDELLSLELDNDPQ